MPIDLEAVRRTLFKVPVANTFNLSLDELGDGRAVVTMPYKKDFDGIFQSFHGGLLMMLADTTACVSILTLTGADEPMTTTDMNIRFLAPCLTDAVAEAKVIKFGRTLCPVAVALRDKNGKEVAIAQVTYMRLQKMPSKQA